MDPVRQLPWLGPRQPPAGHSLQKKPQAAGAGAGQAAGLRDVRILGRTRSSSRPSAVRAATTPLGAAGGSPPLESLAPLTRPLAAEPVLDVVGLVGEEFDEFVLVLLGDALALQQEPPARQPVTAGGQGTPRAPGGSSEPGPAAPSPAREQPPPLQPQEGQREAAGSCQWDQLIPRRASAARHSGSHHPKPPDSHHKDPVPARTANFRLEATSPSILTPERSILVPSWEITRT